MKDQSKTNQIKGTYGAQCKNTLFHSTRSSAIIDRILDNEERDEGYRLTDKTLKVRNQIPYSIQTAKNIELELERKIMQKYAKIRVESKNLKETPRIGDFESENYEIGIEYVDDKF